MDIVKYIINKIAMGDNVEKNKNNTIDSVSVGVCVTETIRDYVTVGDQSKGD